MKYKLYIVLSMALPMVLFHPVLIYCDLSGMGGYDGFASAELMEMHSYDEPSTGVYKAFGVINAIWLLSLSNIPLLPIIALARRRSRP